jgi:hypothetical protein
LLCVARIGERAAHGDMPEQRMDQRSRELAEDRLAKKIEQEEGPQVGEDRRRKQGQATNTLGKQPGVLDSDGAAAIVPDDVPPLQ